MNDDVALILGARSDIGMAIAHRLAQEGYDIQLAARCANTLMDHQSDLEIRHSVEVTLYEFDALAVEDHETFVDDLKRLPSVVISVVGYMGKQNDSERDIQKAIDVLRTNFEGPASILSVFANRFEKRGYGTIVGISSVAGERGRASNYIYGSAKAGFSAFLSGMRNRLAAKGIHVVTILPGYVATTATEAMQLPQKLTADPTYVAAEILHAIKKKKDIVYIKKIWRLIMFIIRNISESIFKRLKIK